MEAPWISTDKLRAREQWNSGSNLSWLTGKGSYFPRGTFGGLVKLEPAQWPPVVQPPYLNAWPNDAGVQQCSSQNVCPWGGPDNAGTVVHQGGVIMRRGQCLPTGRCDCPIGQSGTFCSGQAHRDAFGSVVWPSTVWSAPTGDFYQASNLW